MALAWNARVSGDDPCRDLAAAVLLQALRDLGRDRWLAQEARQFLASEDGQWYADALQIPHEALMQAAEEAMHG